MPRFFFNVHDGSDMPDRDGSELQTVVAAKAHALKYAGQLLSELKAGFWTDGEWRMDVTDERGLILFSFLFVGTDAPSIRRPTG